MTDMNNFFYENGVHDVLAVYINRILSATLRSEYKNIEVLTADRELTDADTPMQVFDGNGSNWNVLMPVPDDEENHPFWIVNNSAATEILTLMSNDEVDTLGTVAAGEAALMMPNGEGGYIAVGSGGGGGGGAPVGGTNLSSVWVAG